MSDRAAWVRAVRSTSAASRSRSFAKRLRMVSILRVSAASCGPEPVVEVAAQAAALLLARGDQPLARALEIGGETDGMRRRADLAGEVPQQAPVRRRELLAGAARRDQQLAHPLALVLQRETEHRIVGSRSRCRSGRAGLPQRDRGVRGLQRTGHRLGDRRQHRIRGERRADAFAQAGEDAVGIIPFPVHQTVDRGLEPIAQRREEHGDQGGGEEGGRQIDRATWKSMPRPPTTRRYSPTRPTVSAP